MRLRRGLSVLATMAALFGAPSAVLGAPPNTLEAALVTPAVGTTATPFVFTVTYLSLGGNTATSVTASVAGRTVSLSRVAGTPISGTWTGTSTLPAGTWTVTFNAVTTKGPRPSLGGGTIVVAALASPTPPRTASPSPARGDEPASEGPTPTAEPMPVEDPTQPAGSGTVVGSTEPSHATTSAEPATGGTGSSGDGVTAPVASPGTGAGAPQVPAASQPPAAGSPAEAGASPSPLDAAATALVDDDAGLVWRILVAGLVAVAAVALIGMAWLLAGRRRHAELEAATAAAPERPVRGRRSRAGIPSTDDPVIAAMGLDRPGTRRPRASQVHRGPGERDASPPPRPRR